MSNIPKPASPLPWRVTRTSGDWPVVRCGASIYFSKSSKGLPLIQQPLSLSGPREQAEQNATYIIWAANNAQALYEALDGLLGAADHSNCDSARCEIARAALKAARGEA